MPPISRLICERCRYTEEIMDYQSLFDGVAFIPLRHPGESDAMRKLGYDESQALREGRVYWNDYCVCMKCYAVVTRRNLRTPHWMDLKKRRTEFWLTLAIAVPVAAISIALDWPRYVGLIVILALFISVEWLLSKRDERIAKRRAVEQERVAREKGDRLETDECSNCGSKELVDYLEFVHKHGAMDDGRGPAMRCPQCQDMTWRNDPTFKMIA